jgi:hypothetical protein
MNVVIWIAIGIILGSIMSNILYLLRTASGTLKIDQSNPEKDLYTIVIDDDLGKLPRKKRILLRVAKTTDISQN